MNKCTEKAVLANIIGYSEQEKELVITYNQAQDCYFSSTVALIHPTTAKELGIDIESSNLQFIEITLNVGLNTLYPKKYFSVLPNPEVLEGGIQLPKQYSTILIAGSCVQAKYLTKFPIPITVYVYHQILGSEYNSSFVQMGLDTMNEAMSKDEFRMQKTVLTTGETFNVMGAGSFSITRILAENPDGGPAFELAAVGLANEFDVEIIFKRVPKIENINNVKRWMRELSTKMKINDMHAILTDICNHYLGTDDLNQLYSTLWQNNPQLIENSIENVNKLISESSELYQQDTSFLRNISLKLTGSNNLVFCLK